MRRFAPIGMTGCLAAVDSLPAGIALEATDAITGVQANYATVV
jgi:hypothetical protein